MKFRLEGPAHEIIGGGGGGLPVIKDEVYLLDDRHLDAVFPESSYADSAVVTPSATLFDWERISESDIPCPSFFPTE
jgi:hypothetical protein